MSGHSALFCGKLRLSVGIELSFNFIKCLLIILFIGCTPYPTLSGRQVVRNVPTGTRPEIPLECRPEIYELMMRTWRKDPRLRPTFTEARLELSRSLCQWEVNNDDDTSDYLDISGFSEDLEHGMVYFNRRIPEFECEI